MVYVAPPAPRLFEPRGLRGYRLFESRDLDDTRQRISTVMQPHLLLPNGRAAGARSHMDFVRIGRIGIGNIAFGQAMRVEVDRLDNYYLLMFCCRGHGRTRADDGIVNVDHHHGIICRPDGPFVADLSEDCEQFVMRIGREAVHAHTGHRNIRLRPALDLGSSALRPWFEYLKMLTGSPILMEAAERNEVIAADVERLLIDLLLIGQAWEPGKAHAPDERAIAPGCVRKAEAYMEANVALPLRLADIAAAAGVPVRTLHDAFRRFRGHSPMHRLHELRLHHANALLRRGGGATRVSEVALDCGYAHFGRFAQAYRRHFGEAPSATLTQCRR